MKKTLILGMTSSLLSFNLFAAIYEVPPSSSTRNHVPVISDKDMERCVKIYNESEWLLKKINDTYVDRYDKNSVNSYNEMVDKHTEKTNFFNNNCAGKQSQSAYEAAKRLNSR